VKLRTVVLAAAVAMIAVAPAHATGTHEYGVEAGVSVPAGIFSDNANTGFNLGAQYQFIITQVGIGAEVKYHGWGGSDKSALPAGTEQNFTAWQYDVFGIVKMPSTGTQPYLKGGMGWYTPAGTIKSPSGDLESSKSVFGVVVGAGLDIPTPSHMTLGIGLNYHRMHDSYEDFMSITAHAMWH